MDLRILRAGAPPPTLALGLGGYPDQGNTPCSRRAAPALALASRCTLHSALCTLLSSSRPRTQALTWPPELLTLVPIALLTLTLTLTLTPNPNQGHGYWCNTLTGESAWALPQDTMPQDTMPQDTMPQDTLTL